MLGRLPAEALVQCSSQLVATLESEFLNPTAAPPSQETAGQEDDAKAKALRAKVIQAKAQALHKLAAGRPAALEDHAKKLTAHTLQPSSNRVKKVRLADC